MAPRPRAGLSFLTSLHDNPTIIRITGELDLSTSHDVEAALLATPHPDNSLILDLSGLRFCDCTGLGTLQHAADCRRDHGGRLALAAPTGLVARLLDAAADCISIDVFATLDDAVAAHQSAPARARELAASTGP